MANAKKILSILPYYILPLDGVVNHESIPRDFEYTLITAYIPKGIHVVGSQLGQISLPKHNDFDVRDRTNYTKLVAHIYLMKTTRNKPRLVSQPWIKELAQSTILNVMNIPHFG
jgi:hypothetical protein